jgi:hypothetical protein
MTVKQFGFVPHVSVKSASTGRDRSGSKPSISLLASKIPKGKLAHELLFKKQAV